MHRFFEEGDKVKVTLRFRGRELAHPELGMKLLQKVQADFEPVAKVRVRAAHGRPPDDHDPGAAVEARRALRNSGSGRPRGGRFRVSGRRSAAEAADPAPALSRRSRSARGSTTSAPSDYSVLPDRHQGGPDRHRRRRRRDRPPGGRQHPHAGLRPGAGEDPAQHPPALRPRRGPGRDQAGRAGRQVLRQRRRRRDHRRGRPGRPLPEGRALRLRAGEAGRDR